MQTQKVTPTPTIRASPVKTARQVGLQTMPLLLSRKTPFHFIVIKMLIDVLLTHSTEPHRFYNSSKHLQVVTCVRLSRQK